MTYQKLFNQLVIKMNERCASLVLHSKFLSARPGWLLIYLSSLGVQSAYKKMGSVVGNALPKSQGPIIHAYTHILPLLPSLPPFLHPSFFYLSLLLSFLLPSSFTSFLPSFFLPFFLLSISLESGAQNQVNHSSHLCYTVIIS